MPRPSIVQASVLAGAGSSKFGEIAVTLTPARRPPRFRVPASLRGPVPKRRVSRVFSPATVAGLWVAKAVSADCFGLYAYGVTPSVPGWRPTREQIRYGDRIRP